MFMSRFLMVFLVLFSLPALAQVDQSSCSDMDIKDYHPQLSKHFSTPRNQGSIGWCYAFAASDLLSVEAGRPVSSFHVAAVYNSETYNNTIYHYMREKFQKTGVNDVYESGWLARAVRKVSERHSICSERSLPFNSESRETNEFVNALDELGKKAHQQRLSLKEVESELHGIIPAELADKINVRTISRSLKTENINVTIEKVVSQSCSESVRVPSVATSIISYYSHGTARYYQGLNKVLNSGRPLALRYHPSIYTKKPSDASHISVLTGRRWKNGKCQYKIRNSWGKSCRSYKAGVECIRSEGAFWIDARDLVDNRNTLYFLDGKGKFELPYQIGM